MKRLKEKLKCIWHIIRDKEYAVFTGTVKNNRVLSCCAIVSDNATKEFKEAIIELLNNYENIQ